MRKGNEKVAELLTGTFASGVIVFCHATKGGVMGIGASILANSRAEGAYTLYIYVLQQSVDSYGEIDDTVISVDFFAANNRSLPESRRCRLAFIF